jgi:hypothetical protein
MSSLELKEMIGASHEMESRESVKRFRSRLNSMIRCVKQIGCVKVRIMVTGFYIITSKPASGCVRAQGLAEAQQREEGRRRWRIAPQPPIGVVHECLNTMPGGGSLPLEAATMYLCCNHRRSVTQHRHHHQR